jgi:LuxR family maltose regulon positive regulatory protein
MEAQLPGGVVAEKTRPPVASASLVSRPKLLRQLDGGLNQRATLVTAPAGFGKTSLLVDWLADHPEVAQCWVTLDEYDNDPMRFLLHVIDSVHGEVPDVVGDGPSMIASLAPEPIWIVDALAQSLAESVEHLILVLDNVHLIENSATLACLEACLNELPRSVHIVMVGRREPGVHLAGRRAVGDLNELRTTDLRLSLDEARAVIVGSLGLELSDVVTRDLHRKTMGWVVGIRLAAAAAEERQTAGSASETVPSVSSVSGAYEAVADYLFEEAFAQLDEREIRFLLGTSLLKHLTPPLCEAVTGEQEAAALLERFVRSGLFTTRVNTPGPWYRYHDLFREALQSRLGREDPDRVADLHRRAATWLHQQGRVVNAIDHAIKAGDSELADDWLVEAVRPFIAAKQGGTLITLLRRLDAISPSLSTSALTGWTAVELTGTGTTEREIDSLLIRLEHKLSTIDHEDPSLITQRWELLPLPVNESWEELAAVVRALLAYRHGNVKAAAAADGIPSESRLVEACAGAALTLLERYPEAEWLLRSYLDYTASPENPIPSLEGRALGLVAKLKAFAGGLTEAEQLATSALDLLRALGLTDHPPAMSAVIAAAWVAWERGQLDTAKSSIAQAIETIDRFGEMPTYVLAGILIARIRWSRGDLAGAHQELDRVMVSPGGRAATGHLADRIALERVRFALLEGDLIAAELAIPDWRRRIEGGPGTMRERLVLARMAISSGGDATVLLGVEPYDAEITVVHRIEIHKLRALAALAGHDSTAALNQLTQAMRFAANTGHRQTFIDEQATFGGLLDNAIARSGHRLRLNEQPLKPPESTRYTGRSPIEPLTERELEVLRLLPSQLTNSEIGDSLSISTNTVKFHVKMIYRKLGAGRRTEAVEHARSLGLIA